MMNYFGRRPSKKANTKKKKHYFLQELIEQNYRNRFWITVTIMIIFILLIGGIGYAMYADTPISKDWKELLLLMLGVFTGSFNQVMQFWFGQKEQQKELLKWAEEEDDKSERKEQEEKDSGKQLLKG